MGYLQVSFANLPKFGDYMVANEGQKGQASPSPHDTCKPRRGTLTTNPETMDETK